MLAVLLCFSATACYAAANVFDARISAQILKRLPTVLFYAGLAGFFTLTLSVLFFGTPEKLPADLLPYAFAYGFLNCFYLVPYYAALKVTDTSIVSALFSMGEILVPVLAFFLLGDKLSASQYAGFFLVIFASVALNVKDIRRFKINAGLWIMLISAAMNSVAAVFYKKLLNGADTATALFWTSAITLACSSSMILIPAFAKDIIARTKDVKIHWKAFTGMYVSSVLAYVLKTFALTMMSVVVYRALSASQPMFVLGYGVCASLFFHKKLQERTSARESVKKIVCFALIIAGIVLTLHAPS